MRFEEGKFYRHTTGEEFSIIGRLNTTMWMENALIAETAGKGFNSGLIVVGDDEGSASNFREISKREWLKNFSE